jgi:Mg2+ and Co2+ transporter CorA
MATTSKEFNDQMCHTCTPKKIAAITSCRGCHHHFCRKHFNEHRDQLSEYLNNTVDQHDEILQDLKTRIDHFSKDQLNNDDAQNLLRQIDQWEERTINACRHAADKVRASVKQLFDKTEENNSLIERLSSVARELEEQQQSENFVERDLDRWMKQLEELKNDINQPIKFPTDIIIETQDIDWEESIKICQLENSNKNVEHYVLIMGERGVGS